MVSDPAFQKLSAGDQQAALNGIDPDFGKLNPQDFSSAVTGMQKRALSHPDLVAPPSAAKPNLQMQQARASGWSPPPPNQSETTPTMCGENAITPAAEP